jgi:hypothetical protein
MMNSRIIRVERMTHLTHYPDATIITCIVDSPMVERSLIYTALTRAKKLCLVVGSMEVFLAAVA